MLLSILDLDKMTVEHIMVPRSEIYAIDINDDWKTILRQLAHCAHTKILLYRDNIDDVVGFLHARDALRLMARDQFNKSSLLREVDEIYFIPEERRSTCSWPSSSATRNGSASSLTSTATFRG